MPTVTVDLNDLETLVFATGAIKTIESVLASRKSDPFVTKHLDFTDAHNRLAAAMRNARREEADGANTLVNFNEPLTEDEHKTLKEIAQVGIYLISREKKIPKEGDAMSIYDRLAAKGCVVMGQLVRGVAWAGASSPDLQVDPAGFGIKITDRGRQKLVVAAVPNIIDDAEQRIYRELDLLSTIK